MALVQIHYLRPHATIVKLSSLHDLEMRDKTFPGNSSKSLLCRTKVQKTSAQCFFYSGNSTTLLTHVKTRGCDRARSEAVEGSWDKAEISL